MSIKGWFENKVAERKAKQAQRELNGEVAKRYQHSHRVSNHDASKKGHKHIHGAGFITRKIIRVPIEVNARAGKKVIVGHRTVIVYKHRPGYDRFMPSNHERVVYFRQQRQPQYQF